MHPRLRERAAALRPVQKERAKRGMIGMNTRSFRNAGVCLFFVAAGFIAGCGVAQHQSRDPWKDQNTASSSQGVVQWQEVTHTQIVDSGWPVKDMNLVGWAQAGRAANEICAEKRIRDRVL